LSLYLDTSLLVSAFTHEADSIQALDWLDAQPPDLIVSDWVIAEFSAALSIKRRLGQIDTTQRTAALASFTRMCNESATVLAISRLHFRTAARLADEYLPGLRAGDALHLALCVDHGATLCTLDRRLCEAAPAFGVQTIAVGGLFP
jgi:predicted nucleic acid-binding protein